MPRTLLLLSISTALVSACNAFGGVDAGPTSGTFHIDNTNIAGANVPATIDATSVHAFIRQHQPTDPYGCGSGPLTEVIGITADDRRAYIRLPQFPPLSVMQSLGPSPCGPYFSIARIPGLPSAEEWVSQSGMLTVTAATATSFTITLTGVALIGINGTAGTFTATASAVTVNALTL